MQLLTEPIPAQVVVVYCAEGNKWEERFYGGVVEGVVNLWTIPQSYLVRVKILLPTQVCCSGIQEQALVYVRDNREFHSAIRVSDTGHKRIRSHQLDLAPIGMLVCKEVRAYRQRYEIQNPNHCQHQAPISVK